MSPPQNVPAEKSEAFPGYRPELDGVRGISILLVLGLHFRPAFVPGGYLGVDIFFVLSGFLITALLLQEWSTRTSISLRDFYIRRALRLGPALVVYLSALGAYAFLLLRKENAHEIYLGILLTLSYVSNWVIAFKSDFSPGILAITWSLAVEEQFYFAWPLLLALLLKTKLKRRSILIGLAIVVVLVGVRRAWLWQTGATVKRLYYATDTHADGLLLGCLAGCLTSWRLIPDSKKLGRCFKALALVSVFLLGCLALTTTHDEPLLYAGGFSLIALAIALALLTIVVWPAAFAITILRLRPLVWVGRISYGLYLWHWPVRGLVFGKTLQPSLKQTVVAVLLSFAIAALSFYVIEQPFLRLKKRFSHLRESAPLQLDSEAIIQLQARA